MDFNTFSFTQKNIEDAKKHLKDKSSVAPSFLKAHPDQFRLKKGNLHTKDGRMVIADEQRDDFLRELVYGDNKYPFARD